jgi:hypothetical protein
MRFLFGTTEGLAVLALICVGLVIVGLMMVCTSKGLWR